MSFLGGDEAKISADIDRILSEYRQLHVNGRFSECTTLISDARKNYPHDYRIMNLYMWDIAGGTAGNYRETLLQNKEELEQICRCILDGCMQDDIRIEAINMKAKLLHAEGKTEEALDTLSKLPSWYASLTKEQLFCNDTPEFRDWNKRNCFGLLDVMSIKLARITRFDPTLSITEKIERLESIAQDYADVSERPHLEAFCIGEHAIYAILAGLLTVDNAPIEDVIRIREKQFKAMEKMMVLAKYDKILNERIMETYGTDDIIQWEIERLINSPHPQFSELRENPEYMKFLLRWRSR